LHRRFPRPGEQDDLASLPHAERWSSINFGKFYGLGKSLPEIVLSDPDWFFHMHEQSGFLGGLALGFLSGCEPEWLPAVTHVLRGELPKIEVTISSEHSPHLAEGVATGKLDAAFMTAEEGHPDLVLQGSNHGTTDRRFAKRPSAGVAGRNPTGGLRRGPVHRNGRQAPVLRSLIEDYFRRSGIDLHPTHRVEYLSMAVSLVASTRGLALLPDFARNFLTWSVISRPLAGEAPSIDLVLGYHKLNNSPLLRLFLSRTEEMIGRVSKRSG
jgi:LysR family transcriptional regulator, hca operon transcriptional activator